MYILICVSKFIHIYAVLCVEWIVHNSVFPNIYLLLFFVAVILDGVGVLVASVIMRLFPRVHLLF